VGILEENKLMIIAAWGSITLHAAVLAGVGLTVHTGDTTFPKPAPRRITVVSTDTHLNPAAVPVKQSIPRKKPVRDTPRSIPEIRQPEEVKEDTSPKQTEIQETAETGSEKNSFKEPSGEASGTAVNGRGTAEIKEPSPLETITPVYPFKARKKGIEGTVTLAVTVNSRGIPVSCTTKKTSGSRDLDEAAIEAVMKSRFSPGTVNGRETESTLTVNISFRLED